MKSITIHVVGSISEEIEQIQSIVRARAYENFLNRANNVDAELDDWLAAERELIHVLAPQIREEEQRILVQIDIPGIKPKDLEIHATETEALIRTRPLDESANEPLEAAQSQLAVGIVKFPVPIVPAGVQAEYAQGVLRLTAPIADEARSFKKSA